MASHPVEPKSPFSETAPPPDTHQNEGVPYDRKFHKRKNSISQNAVMSMRARLSDDEQVVASNDMINQFLRATGGDQDHVCPYS